MEQSRIDMFVFTNRDYFTPQQLFLIKDSLKAVGDEKATLLMSIKLKNPTTLLIISLLFGDLGIDRFVLGKVGTGILKLLTFGGLGIWTIIDWFLIKQRTYDYNFKKLNDALMCYSFNTYGININQHNLAQKNESILSLFLQKNNKYFSNAQKSLLTGILANIQENNYKGILNLQFKDPSPLLFIILSILSFIHMFLSCYYYAVTNDCFRNAKTEDDLYQILTIIWIVISSISFIYCIIRASNRSNIYKHNMKVITSYIDGLQRNDNNYMRFT